MLHFSRPVKTHDGWNLTKDVFENAKSSDDLRSTLTSREIFDPNTFIQKFDNKQNQSHRISVEKNSIGAGVVLHFHPLQGRGDPTEVHLISRALSASETRKLDHYTRMAVDGTADLGPSIITRLLQKITGGESTKTYQQLEMHVRPKAAEYNVPAALLEGEKIGLAVIAQLVSGHADTAVSSIRPVKDKRRRVVACHKQENPQCIPLDPVPELHAEYIPTNLDVSQGPLNDVTRESPAPAPFSPHDMKDHAAYTKELEFNDAAPDMSKSTQVDKSLLLKRSPTGNSFNSTVLTTIQPKIRRLLSLTSRKSARSLFGSSGTNSPSVAESRPATPLDWGSGNPSASTICELPNMNRLPELGGDIGAAELSENNATAKPPDLSSSAIFQPDDTLSLAVYPPEKLRHTRGVSDLSVISEDGTRQKLADMKQSTNVDIEMTV